ncbi:MAG: peptidylprolyl isomerase [candidate division FCPU426 bacterium]
MKRIMAIGLCLCGVGWLATGPAGAGTAEPGGTTPVAVKAVPAGQPVVLDRVEIRVGNEIITTQDLEEPIRQIRERLSLELRGVELEAKVEEYRKMNRDRLIEGKLLLLEAREQKIEVQDTVVEEQTDKDIEALKAQFPSPKAFREKLEQEHLTEQEFRKIRQQITKELILRQRLLQTKMQELKTGAEVSEAQLKAYYQEHRKDFQRPSRARVSQIFVARPDVGLPTDEFARRDQQARAKIQEAAARLKQSADFSAVAREFSEHAATKDRGGDIGWIEPGDTGLKEFEKVVFGPLALGKPSAVIDTARGYFIVRVEDRQSGGQMPYEEVVGQIRKQIMEEGSEARYKAWIESLKQKYKVEYADKKN